MVLTRKQKISFYKNRKKSDRIISSHIKKKGFIIFGARSLNAHFPAFLDKQTSDYDVLIPSSSKKNTKLVAQRLEKKLDKRLKGDFFVTESAQHPGTFKIRARLGKEGIVDITKAEKKVRTDKIKGIKYSSLKHEKANINKSLNDPESSFRHEKDKERLERIRIFEGLKKKKKTFPTKKRKTLIQRASTVGRIPRNAFTLGRILPPRVY